ncbi:laccase domain protein [Terrihabitans soli]|uniref:Purine nucleoside phosphorylase n=1 Tax=Terrihabitans soli TaxID=708113 RepID=A0A6S6QSS0_9HYPH|nr:peptidoglycan editing factor PgeF [Terrihabitans soli]BCJ90111.1 laccase domain protein [Terrihabitans soli]
MNMPAVPFIAAPALSKIDNVAHAFFTRDGGVSTGLYASLNGGRGSNDDPDAVAENRARMTATLGVKRDRLATPYQIHSPTAVVAFEPWAKGEAPEADAVVTATPGLAVGISTADCGPILFADGGAGVVAAAHAGWKGALGGVIESTLDAMEKLGARRGSITAALGPCIRQPSYEVGPEFVTNFRAADMDNLRFFKPAADGKSLFDLGSYIVSRLKAAEVATVEDLGFDTYADETRFYSFRRTTHRKEPDYGRLVAAIALRS